MGLKDKIEQHPLVALLVVTVAVASAAWGFLDQVLVRPRDEEFARLQRRLEELQAKEQAPPSATASQPGESSIREEGSGDPLLADASSERGTLEQSTVARDIKTPSETRELAPSSSIKPQVPQSEPLFQTESYRLEAEEVKKSGSTVRVTMVLEVVGERGLDFHAGGWHLIDENGEQWNELSSDSPSSRLETERAVAAGLRAPFRDKIHLVYGTRVKDSLVFSSMGSGHGVNFTLIGLESDPQPRREIVLRGLVASGD